MEAGWPIEEDGYKDENYHRMPCKRTGRQPDTLHDLHGRTGVVTERHKAQNCNASTSGAVYSYTQRQQLVWRRGLEERESIERMTEELEFGEQP